MRKGEIYYADLSPVVGSEQGGIRPVLIVQNNIGNQHSATTIVAPLTTRDKSDIPTHVSVRLGDVNNVILLEQLRAVSRTRLISKFGEISEAEIVKVDKAMRISLGIIDADKERECCVPPPHRERRKRNAK